MAALLLCSIAVVKAQTSGFNPLQMPVLPQAPNSAMLGRFGDYQVNLFSGLPDISIPLYTIKTQAFEVPITLSYHASGNRVHDFPSWVGLGWGLNTGGEVRRKMVGRPDELTTGFLASSEPENSIDIEPGTSGGRAYLVDLNSGYRDLGADIFSYNFPGGNGKFIFNRSEPTKPFVIPYSPIKITYPAVHTTPQQLNFDIWDASGNHYEFGKSYAEYTHTGSTGGSQSDNTSAWMLEKMVSPSLDDIITFSYVSQADQSPPERQDTWVVEDKVTNHDETPYYSETEGNFSSEYTSSFTTSYNNTEIKFRNGKVVFELATSARQDFDQTNSKALQAIKVYSSTTDGDVLIRTITFSYSYFGTGTSKRLRLDAIQIKDRDNADVQTYNFSYNNTITLPARDAYATGLDYWGYYNGRSNNTLVPQTLVEGYMLATTVTDITIGSTNPVGREPDEQYMQAGILKSIRYPTGGRTDFEFETNKYKDANNNIKLAGGLRVKRVTSYPCNGKVPQVKTYKYGLNESGYGRANFWLTDYYFYDIQQIEKWVEPQYPMVGVAHKGASKRRRTYYSNPSLGVQPDDGTPVAYEWVTEYEGYGGGANGKTIYHFRDAADEAIDLGGNIGSSSKATIITKSFNRGQPLSKVQYRKNSAGSYLPVQEEQFTYNVSGFAQAPMFGGLQLRNQRVLEGVTNYTPSYSNDDFYYNNYYYKSDDNYLTSKTVKTYDPDDNTKIAQTVTNYTYDNFTHQQPTQIATISSRSKMQQLNMRYPADVSATTLQNANMQNAVIEQWLLQYDYTDPPVIGPDPIVTKGQVTLYKQLGNGLIVPDKQKILEINAGITDYAQASDSRYTDAIQFDLYDDKGNVTQAHKPNDASQAFVWGYNSSMLIAEVKNAAAADVAYTSFEADSKGNWTFSGTPAVNSNAITGKKTYSLSGRSVSKSGLSSGTAYTVGYWSRNGSYTVTGSGTVKTGRSYNGWTYYEHPVTGTTSITVSGSGTIDELRLYPAAGFMTTYTYEPLVGVTSQSDVNNRISYYEYDRFNRLAAARDMDNNILKKYEYSYTGLTGTCDSGIDFAENSDNPDCRSSNCSGVDKKCVNGVCETGVMITLSCVRIDSTTWQKTYYYKWSDNSVSSNYTVNQSSSCLDTPLEP
ncbi:MAG: hypothetical protein QM687_17245 [Ferruginibacter sp.]